jgi:L-alanine-DL-glutamate epimerase-like enolase superfamily enzyme
MKIDRVTCYPLAYGEPNDYGATRHTLIVRVDTDDGIVGWGEAVAMWPEAVKATATLIQTGLFEVIRGADPRDAGLWERMRSHTWWYGRGGIASMAIAALDMAIWDLRGKAAGQPLHELLGGLRHNRLPACASIHPSRDGIAANVQEIVGYVEQGYRFVKFGFAKKGLAGLGRDPEHDLAFVRAVSRDVGDSVKLVVDFGNGVNYDAATVERMAREFLPLGNVLWLEEPFKPHELELHRALRDRVGLPIGAGERDSTPEQYRHRIAAGAADVLGIDPARAEGVTAFAAVSAAAAAAGVSVNAHAWSTAITSAASLALSLSTANTLLFEFKPLRNPMQHDLVAQPVDPQDGWAVPQSAPGLGIEVLDEILACHTAL